ncbi:MAG: transcription elongation factor GreA [Patescibacteria group bacterium]|jgi:transcription elongation factor GreA
MENFVTYTSAIGLQNMKEELENRVKIQRSEIAQKIHDAKEMGDLSENFAYHEAKEQQAQNETRIANLQEMIANAVVVEERRGGKIGLGSTFIAEINNIKKTFEIVGENEASPMEGKISNNSPLGNAFLGAKEGESVDVTVPSGVISYRIIEVK